MHIIDLSLERNMHAPKLLSILTFVRAVGLQYNRVTSINKHNENITIVIESGSISVLRSRIKRFNIVAFVHKQFRLQT